MRRLYCKRGQISANAIGAIGVVIVIIAVLAYAFSEVSSATIEARSGTRQNTTLLNTTFTDNTDATIKWENRVDDNAVISAAGENISVTVQQDNDDTMDVAYVFQAIIVPTGSEVESATMTFKYCIVDNTLADTLQINMYLDDGTDNETWYSENTPNENATTYTTIENTVTDNIGVNATYTMWIVVQTNYNIQAVENAEMLNIQVDIDDANFTVKTYTKSMAENMSGDVSSQGTNVFKLMLIIAIIIVIGLILRAVGVF